MEIIRANQKLKKNFYSFSPVKERYSVSGSWGTRWAATQLCQVEVKYVLGPDFLSKENVWSHTFEVFFEAHDNHIHPFPLPSAPALLPWVFLIHGDGSRNLLCHSQVRNDLLLTGANEVSF